MSVIKALEHSAFKCQRKVNIEVCVYHFSRITGCLTILAVQWVDSSNLEPEALEASPMKYHDAWRSLVSAK
jgi:CTP synthase